MALQNIRQFQQMEDGSLDRAPIYGGLMDLPGANTSVANPLVAEALTNIPSDMAGMRSAPGTPQAMTPMPREAFAQKTVYNYDPFLVGGKTRDLYQALLGREPDKEGLDYWLKEIGSIANKKEIERFIDAAQPEFNKKTQPISPVTEPRTSISNPVIEKTTIPTVPTTEIPGAREVVDSGQTATQRAAQTLPGQLYGFDTSGFKSGSTLEDVYQQFLGRTGDIGGLQYWTKEIGPTVEMDELTRFLEKAAPERERVSKLTTPDVVSVKDLYNQALGRTNVSPQELAFWQKQFGRDISPAEVERFLASAKTELDTSKFTPFSKTVDPTTFPKFEGRAYNPAAYENLVDQLSNQQKKLEEKGFKYGSTFGGAQETIDDIAKRLASMGISNIYDLGMKHELPVEKIYETIEQDEGPSLQFDTGKYRTISGVKGRGPEGEMIYEYRELTPDEVKKLQFDKSGMGFLPIGMADREALMNTPFATTKYYNKKTGEELDTRKIGGKAESGLFASSGAGDGYTNYRVMYAADGTPVVIPEKNLSGMKEFIAEDLSGILSVLRFIPGAQIPVMLAQAAAAAYMGAKPEDILKQAAISYVSGNMDKLLPAGLQQIGVLDKPVWDDYLGKFVGGTPTTDLGKLALKAGSSGLASLIQSGGDLEQALKSSGIALLGDQISGLIPKGDIGGISYSKLLDIFAPSLARGEITNADIFRFMSSLAQEEAKKKKPPSGG